MLDRERFIKIAGMLSNAHQGEILNAAERANEMLQKARMTWGEVLDSGGGGNDRQLRDATATIHRLTAERDALLAELARAQARAAGHWVEPESVEEALDRCADYADHLTDWERGFVQSLAGWRGRLTERQRARLDELIVKVRRIARITGGDA